MKLTVIVCEEVSTTSVLYDASRDCVSRLTVNSSFNLNDLLYYLWINIRTNGNICTEKCFTDH